MELPSTTSVGPSKTTLKRSQHFAPPPKRSGRNCIRPQWCARGSFLCAWLALEDDVPVGAASLTVVPTLPRFAATRRSDGLGVDGRVRDVYVSPAHRRRGFGRALLLAVLDEAERRGIDRLTLGASAMGRALYLSLGFVEKSDEMVFLQR